MTKYGQQGQSFTYEEHEIKVDTKFLLSSLMAIIVALGELVETKNLPEGFKVEDIIESMASNIYENIKETELSNTERTIDTPA